MPRSFYYDTDANLRSRSQNFLRVISSDPQAVGLDPSDCAQYALVHQAYVEALRVCTAPQTRTTVTVEEKRRTRAELMAAAASLTKRIEGTASVTPSQKIALGIVVRTPGSRINVPTEAPVVVVSDVIGRKVRIKLMQQGDQRVGRAHGIGGAKVFTYLGDEPLPAEISGWQYQCSTTRSRCEISFPASVPAFSKVWVVAAWTNPRQETGPLSNPIFTHLGFGLVNPAA